VKKSVVSDTCAGAPRLELDISIKSGLEPGYAAVEIELQLRRPVFCVFVDRLNERLELFI